MVMGPIEANLIKVQDGVASAWCKGESEFRQEDGLYLRCPNGWASFIDTGGSTPYKWPNTPTSEFLTQFIRYEYLGCLQVSSFNDKEETTQQDMIWFLDEAINAAHEMGV